MPLPAAQNKLITQKVSHCPLPRSSLNRVKHTKKTGGQRSSPRPEAMNRLPGKKKTRERRERITEKESNAPSIRDRGHRL